MYIVRMDIHGKSGDAEASVWWKSCPRIQCTHGHPWKVEGKSRDAEPGGKVILEYNVHMDIHGKSGDAEASACCKSYPRIQCTHGHPRKVWDGGGKCLVEKLS